MQTPQQPPHELQPAFCGLLVADQLQQIYQPAQPTHHAHQWAGMAIQKPTAATALNVDPKLSKGVTIATASEGVCPAMGQAVVGFDTEAAMLLPSFSSTDLASLGLLDADVQVRFDLSAL
jgi:hypothetical protein